MTLGEKIKISREAANMTQEELGKKCSVTKQTIFKYENNIITNIPLDNIEIIADCLGVSKSWLTGWDEEQEDLSRFDNILPITTRKIPLLGSIACGEPIYADENIERYVNVGTNVRADFALKAKGDSMINARIQDGDIVFIRKQDTVDNGQIAAVIIEDEATLKRVYFGNDNIMLVAENTAYTPIVITKDEHKTVRILGRAVAFQSDIR